MKVRVDLYKPSGKWYAGDFVEVDESIPMFDPRHKQNLVDNQRFMCDGAFEDYFVVVAHTESYATDSSTYFCQALYAPGAFAGMRKRP